MKKMLICVLLTYCILVGSVAAVTTSSSSSTGPTNMVVDFDSTELESNLMPGESGILNLVIENTGDYIAKNVDVWIPSTAKIHIDKRLHIGEVSAGESKTLPIWIRVDKDANTGLTGIQVTIGFDGYDAEGTADNNQETTWEIPVYVYGNPSFQITPEKTTFYKDSLDKFNLEGLALSPVEDLESLLSSSCVTVLGSSRKYVGDIQANQKFNISYDIKSSTAGLCTATLQLSYIDESVDRVLDNVTLGFVVEDAGVDFKLVNISYEPTAPGKNVAVNLQLKNMGESDAEDTTVSLNLTDPFTPLDTSEKYIGPVQSGGVISVDFTIAVGWDAETKVYSIPLNIDYKVGGTSYSVKKDIGLDVSGDVILEIIKVDASGSSLKIDVANIGTHTAEGVKATLITDVGASVVNSASNGQTAGRQRGGMGFMPGIGRQAPAHASGEEQETPVRQEVLNQSQLQQYVAYKSDIKPSKQTTFSFDVMLSGPATLILEYNGPNNERVTQREKITVNGGQAYARMTGAVTASRSGGSSVTTILMYGAAAVVVFFLARKLYSRRKSSKK